MKQVKILFLLITLSLLSLMLVSCVPGGAGPAQGWSGATLYDGIVYVGSMKGEVVAINSSTRNLEWSYTIATPSTGMSCGRTSTPAAIYGTPAAAGDLVYIGTYSGKVYALNIARGTERWVYPREGYMGAIVGSPLITDDIIYVSSSDGRVYALDTTYGDLKWKSKPLADKLWTSPTIDGNTIYVNTFDGHVYALSTENGSLLPWTFKVEAGFASSPVIYGDTMLLASFDRYLYAVKIGNDTPIWKFPKEKPADNWFWAAPVVDKGVVYASCLDGKIYAVDAETGERLWDFDAGSPIIASPVLVKNLLVVASESGDVYILKSGVMAGNRLANKVSLKAPIQASLSAHEGIVYVRGQDDWLYAINIDRGKVDWKLPLTTE